MSFPYTLSNGPGNVPDADKLMANFNYLSTLFKILQVIQATSTSSFSTTSSSFQNTNLSGTITPSSASSKILCFVFGAMFVNAASAEGDLTIARGGTNLGGARGMAEVTSPSSGGCYFPISAAFLDSPASTSPLTYTAQIKNSNGSTQITFGDTFFTQVMILMEVGQ